MIYNNVTNTLRNWCSEMTRRYSDEYQQERMRAGQSLRFLTYTVTAELHYKLGALVDRDFPNYKAYLNAVSELMSIHIDFTLKKELGKVEIYYIRTAEIAFLDYLKTLSPDCLAPACPYYRIIRGEEADMIADNIFSSWGYDTSYWHPLNGESGTDRLFIAPKRIEPYLDEIRHLLGIPQEHIYEYGEAWYDHPHCAEVDDLKNYSGCETAYCAKDFSWIIYYSHENTVTFAGSIVPRIKEILRAEQEYWNRFD